MRDQGVAIWAAVRYRQEISHHADGLRSFLRAFRDPMIRVVTAMALVDVQALFSVTGMKIEIVAGLVLDCIPWSLLICPFTSYTGMCVSHQVPVLVLSINLSPQ